MKAGALAGSAAAPAPATPPDDACLPPPLELPPPPPPPQPAASASSMIAPASATGFRTLTGRMLLAPRTAPHQRGNEILERGALEHLAHAFGDRQLDPQAAREVAQHRRRGQALDDLADLGVRLFGCRAAGDQLARAPVAPE